MNAPFLKLTGTVSKIWRRDFGVFVPALQKANDPIQQLFLDKIREFKSKSKDGKLVEPSPEMMKELERERLRVLNQYRNQPGEDITKFPQFNFTEPKLEKPGLINN